MHVRLQLINPCTSESVPTLVMVDLDTCRDAIVFAASLANCLIFSTFSLTLCLVPRRLLLATHTNFHAFVQDVSRDFSTHSMDSEEEKHHNMHVYVNKY